MIPCSQAGASSSYHGLKRAERIRRRADFLRVQGQGKRVHTPHFLVMISPAATARLGITVTKRIACAVGRNRVKRLVREVYRLNRSLFPAAAEIVVIARRGAHTLDYAAVRSEMERARHQLLAQGQARAGAPVSAVNRDRRP